MSRTSSSIGPSGTAMVGGAIAIAILRLLVRKNVLTIDDVRSALKTAQGSLVNSPTVTGSIDGAKSSARSPNASRGDSAGASTKGRLAAGGQLLRNVRRIPRATVEAGIDSQAVAGRSSASVSRPPLDRRQSLCQLLHSSVRATIKSAARHDRDLIILAP